MQWNPGWKAVDKEKFYNRHHYSQFAKTKKNKNKNKRKKKGTSVPVHPPSVPVHPEQKEVVAKVYRYTTKVYRYMRPVFGQIGFFLTQKLVPFDIPHHPTLSTKPNPSLFALSHKHPPSSFVSARVSFTQARILLHSSYGRGKPLETP